MTALIYIVCFFGAAVVQVADTQSNDCGNKRSYHKAKEEIRCETASFLLGNEAGNQCPQCDTNQRSPIDSHSFLPP